MGKCVHNQRCRYTNGYFCEDCGEFFSRDSDEYRRTEYISSIWMVMNNINCRKKTRDPDVDALKQRVGIGVNHDHDYEEIIREAEVLMAKHNYTPKDMTVVLK